MARSHHSPRPVSHPRTLAWFLVASLASALSPVNAHADDCDTSGDPALLDQDGDLFPCANDCDDQDASVNPAAAEVACNGKDDDCDPTTEGDVDSDADGFSCAEDCDETDSEIHPEAEELCNDNVDQDCDGIDDDVHDNDGDGSDCTQDCDDSDPLTFPGAPEICDDGIDQDCDVDGSVDEASGSRALSDDDSALVHLCSFDFPFCGSDWSAIYIQDNGRLTFGFDDRTSTGSPTLLVQQTPQLAALWTDLSPAGGGETLEVEVIEEPSTSLSISFSAIAQYGVPGSANTFTVTLFADGTAAMDYGSLSAVAGLVGYACDDEDVHEVDLSDYPLAPGAWAIGKGTEGAVYQQFTTSSSVNDLANESIDLCLTSGVDTDGDGWTEACGDCDPDNADAYPGAPELCDSTDNDCNGVDDDIDNDSDGFIDSNCGGEDCNDSDGDIRPDIVEACNGIDDDCDGAIEDEGQDEDEDGHSPCSGDCDDGNASIHPNAEEFCDSVDNDCDGEVDEGFTPDADQDDHRSLDCGGEDCDDANDAVFPSAPELCDLMDNNCDEVVDDLDADEDGHVDIHCGGNDCNDTDPDMHPEAPEVPYDGIDNDCSGGDMQDADGDSFRHASLENGSDCDDSDETVFPGADESCSDGVDNDCDERVDRADPDCGLSGLNCAASLSSTRNVRVAPLALVLLLFTLSRIRRRNR